MARTQKYFHLEAHPVTSSRAEECSWFGAIEFIAFGGKKVACMQVFPHQGPSYAVVPGYQASEPYRTEHDMSVMDVIPLSKDEQDEVRPLVRDLFKISDVETISFWQAE